MGIFKYCDEIGIKILSDFTIKVTPPYDTNDLSELYSVFKSENPVHEAEKIYKHALVSPNLYHNNIYLYYSKGLTSYQKFKQFARANKARFIQTLLNETPAFEEELRKTMHEEVFSRWGISSFTDSFSNNLMWTHYCDKNTGFVVEFNEGSRLFQEENYVKVKYREKPFHINPFDEFTPQIIKEIVSSKRMEWSYENESRLLYHLSECERVADKKGFYFVKKIAPADLCSVTFGQKCSSQFISQACSALDAHSLKHVARWRAHRNESGEVNRVCFK